MFYTGKKQHCGSIKQWLPKCITFFKGMMSQENYAEERITS